MELGTRPKRMKACMFVAWNYIYLWDMYLLYTSPTNDTTFKLSVFWLSNTERRVNELRFSDFFKWGLPWLPVLGSTLHKVNFKHWSRDGKYDKGKHYCNFSRLKTKTINKKQNYIIKKVYNKHIIIIGTWSGVQYHVIWWYDLIHLMWYSTPD